MLESFVEMWNEGELGSDVTPKYRGCYESMLDRQWAVIRSKHDPISMSQLGKPVVLQWLHMHYPMDEITPRLRWIFTVGDFFELLVLDAMRAHGIKVAGGQETLTHTTDKGNKCTGHLDSIVVCPDTGERAIVEVKTMSTRYFKQFLNRQDDERGYLTQLTMYSEAKRLPAYWLCVDKSIGTIAVVPLSEDNQDEILCRADDAIDTLAECSTLSQVYEGWAPPKPVPERYRKRETGEYLLPATARYSPYSQYIYDLSSKPNGYGKPATYVNGFREPDEVEQLIKAAV